MLFEPPILLNISSVIKSATKKNMIEEKCLKLMFSRDLNLPAILAVMKQTQLPHTNALIATDTMADLLSGTIAPKLPIMMPRELGFAKPQIA